MSSLSLLKVANYFLLWIHKGSTLVALIMAFILRTQEFVMPYKGIFWVYLATIVSDDCSIGQKIRLTRLL